MQILQNSFTQRISSEIDIRPLSLKNTNPVGFFWKGGGGKGRIPNSLPTPVKKNTLDYAAPKVYNAFLAKMLKLKTAIKRRIKLEKITCCCHTKCHTECIKERIKCINIYFIF